MRQNFIAKLIISVCLCLGIFSCKKNEHKNLPPSIPSILSPLNKASELPKETVLLKWNPVKDPESSEVLYKILLSDEKELKFAKQIAKNLIKTEYQIESLNANTEYFWEVLATDDAGNTVKSEVYSFTTREDFNPSISARFPANNAENIDFDIKLEWDIQEDFDTKDIEQYLYLGKTNTLNEKNLISKSLNTNKFDHKLEPNTEYYWQVELKNKKARSCKSPIFKFKTKIKPVPQVRIINPENGKNILTKTTKLTWDITEPEYAKNCFYTVYIGENKDITSENIHIEKTDKKECTFALEAHKKYFWKVELKNDKEIISSTKVSQFASGNNTPTKVVVTKPKASEIFEMNTVIFEWNKSTDADNDDLNYKICISENEKDYSESISVDGLSYTANNLVYGKTYKAKIITSDGIDNVESEEIQFSIKERPELKINITNPIQSITNNQLKLDISWSTENDKYYAIDNYKLILTNEAEDKDYTFITNKKTYRINIKQHTNFSLRIEALNNSESIGNSESIKFTSKNIAPKPANIPLPWTVYTYDGKFELNWTKPYNQESDPVNYKLYISKKQESIGAESNLVYDLDQNKQIIKGLEANTTFYAVIIASDGIDTAKSKNITIENHDRFIPNTNSHSPNKGIQEPQNLKSKLSWNYSDLTKRHPNPLFKIYLSEEKNNWDETKLIGTTTEMELDVNLPKGNRFYYWKVECYDGKTKLSESGSKTLYAADNPPSKASIIAPSNNAVINSQEFRIEWNKSTDIDDDEIKYAVCVSKDPNMSSMSITTHITETSKLYDLITESGDYYIAIKTYSAKKSVLSDPIHISVKLPSISNKTPEDNYKKTFLYKLPIELERELDFNWDVSNIDNLEDITYDVIVYYNGKRMKNLSNNTNITNTSQKIKLFLNTGSYKWEVIMKKDGKEIARSEKTNFKINAIWNNPGEF
ncbi:MAG: fibronectin type III domain-containing protein [Marinifilaceae bacterium]|jgi:hypothetical protein|nr:fibronectin type III domain-containing protein [Marinifilaceae bacterium]